MLFGALVGSLILGMAQGIQFQVNFKVGDTDGCQSAATSLQVQFSVDMDVIDWQDGCVLTGPFDLDSRYSCKFNADKVTAFRVTGTDPDLVGLKWLKLSTGDGVRDNTLMSFTSGSWGPEPKHPVLNWIWIGDRQIKQTFDITDSWEYTTDPVALKTYEVRVQVGACRDCPSSVDSLQVRLWHDGGLRVDNACEISGDFSRKGNWASCTFQDTTVMRGVLIKNGNSADSVGLSRVVVYDRTNGGSVQLMSYGAKVPRPVRRNDYAYAWVNNYDAESAYFHFNPDQV